VHLDTQSVRPGPPPGISHTDEAWAATASPPESGTRIPIESDAPAPTPFVRLYAGKVLVLRSEGLSHVEEDMVAPLIDLSFDYPTSRVRAREHAIDVPGGRASEHEARRLLERLGAVELDCVDCAPATECDADYVIGVDGEVRDFCAFTATAVPRLRAAGWRVEIDPAYPFHVIAPSEVTFFARVAPNTKNWFALELGVEVNGVRFDLLELVLDLLDNAGEDDDLRSVERRLRSPLVFKVSDTHHVAIPPDRLRALVRVVAELYQGVRKRGRKVVFPESRASALATLEKVLEGAAEGAKVRWEDPSRIVPKARAIAGAPEPVAQAAELRATLRPYQHDGVAFLQHLRKTGAGGVLADDMGLGKTLQAIAHVCIEKAEGRLDAPVLVVGPTTLAFNWAREIERFAPHLRVARLHGPRRRAVYAGIDACDIVITTYPVLLRDQERLSKHTFHTVILDEAQAIKNARSQVHQAICQVRSEHRVCLTGTPVENHLGELWALFDFLSPGLLGDELGFRRWYRQPIEEKGDVDRMDALRELVAPYILRRTKREVASDLPPKTELLRPVEIRGRQRELYESIRVAAHADVRKVIRQKGLAASTIPILDALMKLRQVCCDPRLVPMDAARGVTESAKYDALFALLEQQLPQGHRVLVFSQFTSMLALIAHGLQERGTKWVSLTGQTRDRRKVVDAFENGEADVFLISLKAGGTGLNLVSADTVVHYDQWWNPASQAQATDRAYRIGQTKPVFVHDLYVAGSVEERVILLQQKKRWLARALLGGAAEEAKFTELDVETLFAPLE
jgi:superfamily II DNA or RNA helicase